MNDDKDTYLGDSDDLLDDNSILDELDLEDIDE